MAQEGGIGIVHKNMTIEQQARSPRREKFEKAVSSETRSRSRPIARRRTARTDTRTSYFRVPSYRVVTWLAS
jgi:IMP dehydrogenase/GMP reductase